MPSLRDRCEAIGAELDVLREEALLVRDEELLPTLKEASRLFRQRFSDGQPGDSWEGVKQRAERELHLDYARDLRTLRQKHENDLAEMLEELERRADEIEELRELDDPDAGTG